VSGRISLSHGVLDATDDTRRIFAELRLRAEPLDGEVERGPLALAVVFDTSGSMSGRKLAEAKRSVLQLIDSMRPDDQIALVRYSTHSEVVQHLARVAAVRETLRARVRSMVADGGTNIHAGLQRGLASLGDAHETSARRLVLVSDGLDSTRAESVAAAHRGAEAGTAISTLGIGLDFDEAYLAEVSRVGHGNFGFVRDASSLAAFLHRELEQTAATTVRDVVARFELPPGVRVDGAVGAHVEGSHGTVHLRLGALRPGAERRVVLRLALASADVGQQLSLASHVRWQTRKGESIARHVQAVSFTAGAGAQQMADSRDPAVFASAVSAFASLEQLRAAEAYRHGEREKAERIIVQNLRALDQAQAGAPEAMQGGLSQQTKRYRATQRSFGAAAPSSEAGRAAAKSAVESDAANLGGVTF
jgi:Ca-activated chloride channel family protein